MGRSPQVGERERVMTASRYRDQGQPKAGAGLGQTLVEQVEQGGVGPDGAGDSG